jgi:acetoacetate decarboxylase
MDRAQMMLIEASADRRELAAVCPMGCTAAPGSLVKVFFAENSQPPNSLRFTEVGIITQVTYRRERLQTMPYIWVSDDIAMIGGREMFGMPKLLMDDQPLQVNAGEISGRLARRGVTMMEGSMVLERVATREELPFAALSSVYERCIPDPDPDRPPLRQLIRLTVVDRATIGPCWMGRGYLETRHPLSSGLDRLRLKPTGRAWYGNFSWNLPNGTVIAERRG